MALLLLVACSVDSNSSTGGPKQLTAPDSVVARFDGGELPPMVLLIADAMAALVQQVQVQCDQLGQCVQPRTKRLYKQLGGVGTDGSRITLSL